MQSAVKALVTDRDGDLKTLHIVSNDGASSSIFEFGLHKDVWPEIDYIDSIDLVTSTLDTLMTGDDQITFDAVVMDTQGSEILVLRGADRILRQVRFIKTECADFERMSIARLAMA